MALATNTVRPTGNRVADPPVMRPVYTPVIRFNGGLITARPPGDIPDNASPDMLNLVLSDRDTVGTDFGVAVLGQTLQGLPQTQPEWRAVNGVLHQLLVTTKTVYSWNSSTQRWQSVPTETVGVPVVASATVDGSNNVISVTYTGAAVWVLNQLVRVETSLGHFFEFPADTIATDGTFTIAPTVYQLAVGESVVVGSDVNPLLTLSATGDFPVDYCEDPVQDWIIFVNGHDAPWYFNGVVAKTLPGVSAANIETARTIAHYHDTTVLGATTESGQFLPFRIRRSATGDATNWTTLNAGYDDLADTGDHIFHLVPLAPYLLVLREKTIVRASYYGVGAQVFFYENWLETFGILGLRASVKTRNGLVMITEPGIFELSTNAGLNNIGDAVFNSLLSYTGEINPEHPDRIFLLHVPLLDETWIFYPDIYHSWCNRVIRYNHKTGAFFARKFAEGLEFSGAGLFTNPQLDTWETAVGTWEDDTVVWAARSNNSFYHIITLLHATRNDVYAYDFRNNITDAGQPIPWYLITKEYIIPQEMQTVDGLAIYARGVVNSIQLTQDSGISWITIATDLDFGVSYSLREVDCSITVPSIQLRFSGVGSVFRLVWVSLKTMGATEV